MTKIRIDLKNGYLEAEGEEAFVKDIYTDYKDVLAMVISRQSEERQQEIAAPALSDKKASAVGSKKIADKAPKQMKTKNLESHKMLGDLDLNPQDGISLRAFIDSKNPAMAQEINTAIVFYLQKNLTIAAITTDHVYTCYKSAGKKVPTALVQSLKDTMRHKGWIDASDLTKIHLTTAGENLVEHELPRQEKDNMTP